MRFIITLITSLILLIPASGQGRWLIIDTLNYPVNTPHFGTVLSDLFDVQFLNQDIGYIGGGACGFHYTWGLLFKTIDGGETWNALVVDGNFSIAMIDFISDTVGWFIGNESQMVSHEYGYIWKTIET